MKKLLSVFLILALAITATPLGAFEFKARAEKEDYYIYSVLDGKATITDVNESISGNITIPLTLGGYPVTSIGNSAFRDCTNLTSVVLGDSVTSIGSFSFCKCSNLTSITIPNSVTSIGDGAFLSCDSLTSVSLGDGVINIGESAFEDCVSLISITIPNGVTSIGNYAFYNCSELKNVYYRGSSSDKSKISIGSKNPYLTNATWYNNSCIGSSEHTYDNTICTVCGSSQSVGDIYGDGKVNLKDLVLIAQFVADWVNIEVEEDIADVNGDEIVDLDDVTHLARYLAGWDGYSLHSKANNGYSPIGNKLIAEVVKYQIETFDGDVVSDLSQPYNSYLPEGTLDYCSEDTIYDASSGNTYRLLGYGKRVYTTSKGVDNIRTMRGSLPETNTLSLSGFTTEGSHTVLTLKTDWKAPFKVELTPQKYLAKTGSNRGTISAATFNYLDITFCYSSNFDIDVTEFEKSPIFSKAQLIKNTADYTLRLYLKATGAFYGWTADYNSDGELVFKFLNPKKATVADNKYGGRLDGIKIVVDPGHGGSDPGAVGNVLGPNKELTEANRSLLLSEMLKTRLEQLGATVIMTRTTDSSLTSDERILVVRNNNPDLAISVHRNAATNTSANGFNAFYFNPFTKAVADEIKNATEATDAYKSSQTKWHVFYMSRISNCPVVLTENGFISNSTDFENMKNDAWNEKCADAIVKGVVNYFLSIG